MPYAHRTIPLTTLLHVLPISPFFFPSAEAYDILKNLGGLSNDELHKVFTEWNAGDLQSFLIEISAVILGKKDDKGEGFLVDKIVDKTGAKGTGE